MDGHRKRICLDYETFGECVFGESCEDKHVDNTCRTCIVFARIAQRHCKSFGDVEFQFTNRGMVSYKSYYIPKGLWYTGGARPGDSVKLQISESIHSYTRLRLARILKVGCRNFDIFGDCKSGENCKLEHFEHAREIQNFYIAKVVSIIRTPFDRSCELKVDLKIEDNINRQTFYVPHHDFWHLKNATAGNLIIVQESSRIHDNSGRSFGKITAVLHNSEEIEGSGIPLEKRLRNGFAVAEITYRRVISRAFVYSITECSCHDECRRIGIHILAAALGNHLIKIDECFVPMHRKNKNRWIDEAFVGGSIRIAISLYVHSANTEVDGPKLTPVFLPSDHIINLSAGENIQSDDFQAMWKMFGEDSFMKDVANTRIAAFMVDSPKIWKTNYLIHYKMRNFANNHLSMYLHQSISKVWAISRNTLRNVKIPDEQVAIPVELAKTAAQQLPSSEQNMTMTIAAMLGFAKRYANNFYEEYIYDVIPCDELPCDENKVFIMTSPLGQRTDYVNQQILLSQMISPGTQLYSNNELLGILVRRFPRPTMYTMMVTQLIGFTSVDLHVCGISGRRQGNQKFPIAQIFKGAIFDDPIANEGEDTVEASASAAVVDSIRFRLNGLACEEYCNTKVALLPGNKLEQLNDAMNRKDDQTVEERIKELDDSTIELDTPYQKDGNDTKVILYRGVKLQLQFSKNSFTDNEDFLSLLKIGEDCHLCLVHLSSTQFAFKNQRFDTKLLVTKTLIAKAEDDIAQNRLKTFVLKEMNIQWNDCYFSGGTFNTNRKITAGNLLCIRKEISETDKRQPFVWICHGVVDEVLEDRVRFLVCNLHQDQTRDLFKDNDNNFVIEVIDVTIEKVSSPSTAFHSNV